MNFKPLSNPLLIVSDNPSGYGGLARMCRDLATLCATLPQFRVGVLGRGMGNRRRFPFTLYPYPETGQWGEGYIAPTWNDFSDGENGVIITLDDASRRHWFANPVGLPEEMQRFLGSGRNFEKWMYLPLDSTGPNYRTPPIAARDCILNYDRVLLASEWAYNTVRPFRTSNVDWLPHGIWTDVFRPIGANNIMCKSHIEEWDGKVVVGCVMANQSRKDFPAAFECFRALKQHYGNRFLAWVHTDDMSRYWSLPALAAEYGVGDCLEVTIGLSDTQLALRYSACDSTILPSGGEGFGYPIAESLACGTACCTTDYAGGAELVEPDCRVQPMTFRVDTQHCVVRAVLSGHAFAQAVLVQVEKKRRDWVYESHRLAGTVEHLSWNNLSHPWKRWLLEGLQ